MRVLFQDGAWRLIDSGLGYPNIHSDIQHRCRQNLSSEPPQEWWYYCSMITCGVCATPIPDELRGLRALHDWDR